MTASWSSAAGPPAASLRISFRHGHQGHPGRPQGAAAARLGARAGPASEKVHGGRRPVRPHQPERHRHAGRGGLKHVTFQNLAEGGEVTLSAQEVFLAPGIVPNSDMLNLQAAGVLTDHRGYVLTNPRLTTNIPHIYAIGDINGQDALRHKANYEAEVLIDILRG